MPSIFSRPNVFKGLSYENDLNVDMGKLIPFYFQPVVPGDEFRVSVDAVTRLMPMLAPLFGQVDLWMHFFFGPNRLAWDNFEDFVTNGLENGITTAVHPYIVGGTSTEWQVGGLPDYFSAGIHENGQPDDVQGHKYDAIPYRLYNKICNDWYRSEFLQNERTFATTDGLDTTTDITLAYRCWPRDYYTSANPFRQLGGPVSLPLGTTAPVIGNGITLGLTNGNQNAGLYGIANTSENLGASLDAYGQPINTSISTTSRAINSLGVSTDPTKSGLVADLRNATAATINDIRTAFQLQRIMERKARSGNRYVEYIASTFGVRSPDARLQRTEFLGGGRAPILISEILQTSSATSTSPQGTMTGHGFGASRTFAFNKAFVEHGWIIGILSVLPKAKYMTGTPRIMLNKESWTDYYQPELAHLGEQPIYKEEVFRAANDTQARDVWGYQPMYEEMRRRTDEVHGDFRTNLNYWTTTRNFNSAPALNGTFVSCDASGIQSNIFAAGQNAVRPILLQLKMNVKAIRPVPRKGTPGMVDH